MSERYQSTFTVPADHPSLPGHFPGAPVVPGVVVLDHVLQACEQWQGRALSPTELRQVKFHSPLLPAELADVSLELAGNVLSFRVARAERPVAQGVFIVNVEKAP